MSDLLANLNDRQLTAVKHDKGPLLIVAGAGTGKTTVLINRLLYLITQKGIKTEEILLTTFTEKAVGELTERADRALPYGYTDLWICTFHGLCERLLREHALDIGLNPDFKLLDTTGQWVLIKKHLDRFALDYYRPLGNPTKFISELISHFSRLKDEDISFSAYLDYVEGLESKNIKKVEIKKPGKKKTSKKDPADMDGNEGEAMEWGRLKELAQAYQAYSQLLLENNYLDFGDLIVHTLKLFRERPNILALYQRKFKYVMVDEFQDTNLAQYELVKMIAGKHNNLLVVGDDDQSIFRFRGTSIFNIMKFKDDYPNAKEILLLDNYRSNQEILDYSYNFIQHNNPNRLEQKLGLDKRIVARKNNNSSQASLSFEMFPSLSEELSFVASKIKELKDQQKDLNWSDLAVLVRSNATADKFVKELARHNIPNEFVSLRGLYYKPIILDCLAYLKLLDNYHESSALFRVLNMEAFKVSHLDLVNINKLARRKVWSLYEALQKVASIPDISASSLKNIAKFLALLEKHSQLVAKERPSKIFLTFLKEAEIIKGLDHHRDAKIFSYLSQFYKKIRKLEESDLDLRLKTFMELIDLELEAGDSGALAHDFDDADVVKVMTIHSAKGLEFKYVFLPSLVDKQFPTIYRGEKIPLPEELIKEKLSQEGDFHLEEERRLFYVALTRAKQRVFLSGAKDYGGLRDKKPSRFIIELGLQAEGSAWAEGTSELLADLLESPANSEPEPVLSLPSKYSFSQFSAYSSCPLQYKFAFILKIPSLTKNQFIFGQLIHHSLYQFLLPLVSSPQASLFDNTKKPVLKKEDLLAIYRNNFSPDNWESASDREKFYKEGENNLNLFYDNFLSASLPDIMFLEKSFTIKIGQEVVKGTIDRIDRLADGTVEIADYKTGNPKESLKYEDKKQLLLYQIVAEELLGLKVSSLAFYYLKNGSKLAFVAKDKELEKIREEIIKIIKEIKSHNFVPTPDERICKHCDFNNICEFRKT